MPRVTVGMPVYNGEPFLAQALDCLLAQSFSDFELVIADNASTDRTREICQSYAVRDPRVRYERNSENIGVDRNFNRVFNLARGEYFRWAAADDLCAPSLLEKCVVTLDAHPEVVLCYSKSRYIDESGVTLLDYEDRLHLDSPKPNKRLSRLLWHIHMCNAVFGLMRASTLRRTGLFGVYSDSDIVFLGELALHGQFFELPNRLFYRRIHPGIAVKKFPSAYDRMAMSAPGVVGQLSFPQWRVFGGFLGAIMRAPLSLKEQLLCCARMHILLRRRWRGLVEDFRSAIRYCIGRKPPIRPMA